MRRILTLLIALCAVAWAGAAGAETCTSNSSFSWSVVTGGDWTGAPCTASAGDNFIIASGHTVTVTGNITQDSTASIGLTVQSGGTLIVAVSESVNSGDSLILTLGDLGLDCQVGSTCTLTGGYREFGVASPTTQSTISTTSYFTVGDLIPCPSGGGTIVPDCNGVDASPGDAGIMRLNYPDLRFNEGTGKKGDVFWDASVADLTAGEDVLCFFDATPNTPDSPMDVNSCYEINAIKATFPLNIDVDVRQGTIDTPGYPLARREIMQTTVTAATTPQQRVFTVDSTVASNRMVDTTNTTRNPVDSGQNQVYVGRTLRFEDGSGNPLSRGYRLSKTTYVNGVADDTLKIGNVDGAPTAHASGETVWVDYGWVPGDPFFVMVPVRVKSATAAERDTVVHLDGTVTVTAAVFDNTAGVQLAATTLGDWSHVWLHDTTSPSSPGQGHIITDMGFNYTLGHTVVSGGSVFGNCSDGSFTAGTLPCHQKHSIQLGGVGASVTMTDLRIRHTGDDCIFVNPGFDPSQVHLRRYICEYVTDEAGSADILDLQEAGTITWSITDGLCIDCSSRDGAILSQGSGASASISRFALWGVTGLSMHFTGSVPVTTTEFFDLGHNSNETTGFGLFYGNTDRFVVREAEYSAAAFPWAADRVGTVKNGIVQDFAVNATQVLDTIINGRVENVALINLMPFGAAVATCAAGGCGMWRLRNTAGDFVSSVTKNVTVAYTPDSPSGMQILLQTGTTVGLANVTLDGVLLAGNSKGGTPTPQYGVFSNSANWAAATTSNWCFFDNQTDYFGAIEGDLPTSITRDQAPGFVDPSRFRFDTPEGSAAALGNCGILRGANAPGLIQKRWMHYVMGTEPEFMGPPSVGGSTSNSAGTRLTAGVTLQ